MNEWFIAKRPHWKLYATKPLIFHYVRFTVCYV